MACDSEKETFMRTFSVGIFKILNSILIFQKAQQHQCLLLQWCGNLLKVLTPNKQLLSFSLPPEIQSWMQRNILAHIVLIWKQFYTDYGLFLMVPGKEQKKSKTFCSLHHVFEVCVIVFFCQNAIKEDSNCPQSYQFSFISNVSGSTSNAVTKRLKSSSHQLIISLLP